MHTRGRLAGAGALVLGAAVLAFLADAWLGPIEIPPYQIRVAGLGYVALAALCLPYACGLVAASVWRVVVALALVGLPLAVVRPAEVGASLGWIAAGAALACLALVGVPDRRAPSQATGAAPLRLAALVVCGFAGLVIAVFQLFNRHQLARGVPNEERSLFVGGVEIHHLVWGVLLITAVAAWAMPHAVGRRSRWAVWALLGLGLGMLVDQWLYFARIDPSDAAYFETSTVVSAWAGLAALLLFWRLVANQTSRRNP